MADRLALDDVAALDLDAARERTDPLADAAVAGYFATVEHTDPAALFGSLVRHVGLPAEDQVPAIREYLDAASQIPEWVDAGAVARGQAFFNRLVAHHFSALYLSSLPGCYAAAKGVQVLRLTGRLQTDAERRLNETGQFLMDIAGPGALQSGGVGIDRILHVRLMHAAVRWLIEHDPAIERVDDAPPPVDERDPMWSTSWGRPVNQEDLVGTWLTFTTVVYDAFDASGVSYDAADVDDHLHMWHLVAHHIGVDAELVPADRPTADALQARIWERQHAPCGAGVAMTDALVANAHRHLPRLSWTMLPTAFRHFVGDDVADILGLPAANWTRHLFPPLNAITRVLTRGKQRHRLHGALSAFLGRRLMNGILAEMRSGDRPDFAIPTHLAR